MNSKLTMNLEYGMAAAVALSFHIHHDVRILPYRICSRGVSGDRERMFHHERKLLVLANVHVAFQRFERYTFFRRPRMLTYQV